jgi:hypothetical protein
VPRTAITVVTVPANSGISIGAGTAGDATNDHSLVNDERTRLLAKNTGGGTQAITILTSYTLLGFDLSDLVANVPTGETWEFGPFPASIYGQSSDGGKVYIDVAASSWTFWATTPGT